MIENPTTDKLDRLFELHEAIATAFTLLPEDMTDSDTGGTLLDLFDSLRQDLIEEMQNMGLTRYEERGMTAQIIRNRLIITQD
ncbi:hypothetical protein VB712_13985 [Spirulina sp. CCNP1310]|uniref:hypothetical protein n=1 Tax=Spirulina sp. CCNP1310 TaxID=3110249 RepID=UPI002B207CBA|nr:hypothetical protein [Spirulina sp. CCNP1310]MEA5420337.1 hypothetical protein [Spirulina sp. CCNP1310]